MEPSVISAPCNFSSALCWHIVSRVMFSTLQSYPLSHMWIIDVQSVQKLTNYSHCMRVFVRDFQMLHFAPSLSYFLIKWSIYTAVKYNCRRTFRRLVTLLYMLWPERLYFKCRISWIKNLFVCVLGSELVLKIHTYIDEFNVVKVQFLTLCWLGPKFVYRISSCGLHRFDSLKVTLTSKWNPWKNYLCVNFNTISFNPYCILSCS